MRIKNRLFPYPTVQKDNGVYTTAKYTTSVTNQVDGSNCKLLFQASISVPEIQKLIEDDKAAFAFHLECSRTYFRQMVTFKDNNFGIIVDGNKIDRQLEICPLIVATKDVAAFTCSDLSDIYADEDISFAKGDVIAVGEQQVLTIIKDKDALKKLSSIFYVDAYPDGNDIKHMTISPDDQQIGILIPKNDAARFSQCKDDPKRKHTLFSAFYFPALIAVVDLMKSQDGDAYSESLWYIHLSAKGREKGIGDVDAWQDRTSFEIAQILFEYPVTRYLKELATASEEEELL